MGEKGDPGPDTCYDDECRLNARGPTGFTGDYGFRGQKGDKGISGDLGLHGDVGQEGPEGFSGQEGRIGERGSPGDSGEGVPGIKVIVYPYYSPNTSEFKHL